MLDLLFHLLWYVSNQSMPCHLGEYLRTALGNPLLGPYPTGIKIKHVAEIVDNIEQVLNAVISFVLLRVGYDDQLQQGRVRHGLVVDDTGHAEWSVGSQGWLAWPIRVVNDCFDKAVVQ